ncbi:MAG: glycosyltransferase [Nonlabens sp.]
MKIAIIIPAYNESKVIVKTLTSLISQTYLPSKIIVVDDSSEDDTFELAKSFENSFLTVVKHESSGKSMPGAKIIKTFNHGLRSLDLSEFDIICKYDADLIFPLDYLEQIVSRFRESENIGMVAGHCTVFIEGKWTRENLTNPDHLRGPLKAYRVSCFQQMGGLRESIGWDTADEMIARYNGWKTITIDGLFVKHLKPTGSVYNSYALKLQGQAFYKLRYGFFLLLLSALKVAMIKKKSKVFFLILQGYMESRWKAVDRILTDQQGRYLRRYRWKGIKSKVGLK